MSSNQSRLTVSDALFFTSIQQEKPKVFPPRVSCTDEGAQYAYAALLLQTKESIHLQLQALVQSLWIHEQIDALLDALPSPARLIPFATIKSALDLAEEFMRKRRYIHGIREVDKDYQADWSAVQHLTYFILKVAYYRSQYSAHTHITRSFGRDEWFEMAAGILGLHICHSHFEEEKKWRVSVFGEYTTDDVAIRAAARMADKVREETLELNGGDDEDTYLFVRNGELKEYVLWFNDYFAAIKRGNRDGTDTAHVRPPTPTPAPTYSHARVEEMRRQFIDMEMSDDDHQLSDNEVDKEGNK